MPDRPMRLLFGDADPDGLAVECGDVTLSRRELTRRALAFASLLRDAGCRAEDHVALLCGNRAEVFEVVLGSLLAGVWLTPVNWHLTPSEVEYILADSGARLVVVDPSLHRLLPASAPALRLGDDYEARLRAAPALELDACARPGGTMMYTSGTSGRPKGVKRGRPASIAEALAVYRKTALRVGFERAGVHLVPGPLYHAAPLLFALYDLLSGSSVLVMERFATDVCLDLLRERRVAHVHLVPTMMARLLRLLAQRAQPTFHGLRVLLHGAAPIAPELKTRAIECFGPVLLEYWGATEGGVYTLVDSREWLERPGTVGRPLAHFDVYAVSDRGERLGPDERGLMVCRHQATDEPFIYHNDPEKTRAAYPRPGVFSVGDLGHVDDAGFVYLSDRRSNLILSGGVNIYPAEVERVLSGHPDLVDVVVSGVPDEEWGQRVVALVEAAPDTDQRAVETALRALCDEGLARYKHPREYRFVRALPRLPSGKVRRDAISALL